MRPILCTIAPGVHRLAITTPPASRSSRRLQTPPRGNMTCSRDNTRLLLAAGMPRDRGWPCHSSTNASPRSRYARWQVVCARAVHHRLRRARLARGGDEQAGHPYGLSRARAEPTSAPVLHLPPHRHDVARSRKECLQLRRQVATGSRQAAVSRCNPDNLLLALCARIGRRQDAWTRAAAQGSAAAVSFTAQPRRSAPGRYLKPAVDQGRSTQRPLAVGPLTQHNRHQFSALRSPSSQTSVKPQSG